jgi:formylglycine-generating enzyme required for sulfatase activity
MADDKTSKIGGAEFKNIENSNLTIGNLDASVTAGGDIVGGDKVTHIHYHGASPESDRSEKPRQPFEPETVLIPAGPFTLGLEDGQEYEGPPHTVYLPDYKIGIYPVTNQEFAAFIEVSGKVVPSLGWPGQKPAEAQKKLPVTGVSWYLALDYCAWLREQTGRAYMLPTEAEWEKAARGPEGQRYPWGDNWQEGRCNASLEQITPVDAYPPQSLSGCYDLVGNLREWTCSLWGSKPRRPDPEFYYRPTENQGRQTWAYHSPRHNLQAGSQTRRIYRGGARLNPAQMQCASRQANMPDTKLDLDRHGFRVVIRVEEG